MTQPNALQSEAQERHTVARHEKECIRHEVEECFKFAMPRRIRDREGNQPEDANDLFTSIGMEVNADFAASMMQTYTPEGLHWVNAAAGTAIEDQFVDQVETSLKAIEGKVFTAIEESNFYSTAPQAYEDLGCGTQAVYVQPTSATTPHVCLHVPINELDISVGPFGGVDDRFWTRKVYYKDLPALLPGVALPSDVQSKVNDPKSRLKKVEFRLGYWCIWDNFPDEEWQYVAIVNKKLVDSEVLRGDGSCPLIVGRWGVDGSQPWGIGWLRNALPELRSVDETGYLVMSAMDKTVHKPFVYTNDGVLNFRDGVLAGMAYPANRNFDIQTIEQGGDLETGYFERDVMEMKIRRLAFQDKPFQQGKTPPTATQWLDETMISQQRLGAAGAKVFPEFAAAVFSRFAFLEQARGTIQPVEVGNSVVRLVPVNPLRRAMRQDEVQVGTRLLEVAAQTFGPQALQIFVDVAQTIQNFKERMEDETVVLRDKGQVMQMMQQVMGQVAGTGGEDANA